MNNEEVWKYIPSYPKYQISNFGRVLSLNYNRTGKPKILKGITNAIGYQIVRLCKEGKVKQYTVHQLVIWAFRGVKPNGHNHNIDHINEIKTDNRLENLEVVTQRENSHRFHKNRTDTSSEYVGVGWYKPLNKYRSSIVIDGKGYHLGYSEDEEQCYMWYVRVLDYLNNHSNEQTIEYIKSRKYKKI